MSLKKDKGKNENFLSNLANRLRQLRVETGLTQEELAERAGLRRSYLADVERGARNVSILTLASIAEAVNVPLSLIFTSLTQPHTPMPYHNALMEAINGLSNYDLQLLVETAHALKTEVEGTYDPNSDLVDEQIWNLIARRLRLHHARSNHKLSKQAFEHLIEQVYKQAGIDVTPASSATFPGADLKIAHDFWSLKTEGDKGIKRGRIKISKLHEARFIRDCVDGADFAAAAKDKVGDHLRRYDRILMLRIFEQAGHFEYHLVEIPVNVLRAVEELSATDFSSRTTNGSCTAAVNIEGKEAFTLRFDGSVEKVTIENLDVGLCTVHGEWVVPK